MNNLVVLIKKDLLEQTRTKKVLTMIIVMLFAAVASPIIAKLTPEILKSVSIPGLTINLPDPTYLDSIDQFVKNIAQIGLLVIIFIVAGAVCDEKSRKTLEIILTKPFSRNIFILSKFCAYFIVISLIFLASLAIFYNYTGLTFSYFNLLNFALMSIGILIYILMIVSVTIFASTLVKNSIAAGGIGFLFYILFSTVLSLFEPLKSLLPNVFLEEYQTIVRSGWNSDYWTPLLISVAIIAVSIILSMVSFRNQEIER